MTNINLTMNKWHLQDKMPYIYLGESGENNVVVLNVEVDDLITSTNDTKVTYFVDIYNQDNLQVANTQPFDIIDNKLVAKLTKGFLTVNGIKKLQIRCVVTDNDYNELQTYLSNQIHASVGQGNFGTTYNTDLADVDTSCKLIIEIFEKFQELFDITNDLKDDIAQQESDLNNLDGIAQKFENIDDGDVDTLLDVRYIYFVTNSLHLPTNGKYLVMPLGNTSVCYGQCAINCETQAIYFRNNEIENDVITWHEWVSSNDAQEQEIQQIKDDVQTLSDSVDTLSDNVDGLHTNIEDLDNSVDNLQDNFSQLQSNVSGLNSNVQTLNNSVDSLNGDVQTLQNDVSGLNDNIQTLDGNISDIQDGINNIWKTQGKLGAKNLLVYPYYNDTITHEGITFTVNNDGSITLNGTSPNYYAVFNFESITSFSQSKGKYILSVDEVLPTGIIIKVNDGTSDIARVSNNTPKECEFEINQDTNINVACVVVPNMVINNFTIHPMLRYAEDNNSTWTPYAMTNKELTDNDAEIKAEIQKAVVKYTENVTDANDVPINTVYTVVASKNISNLPVNENGTLLTLNAYAVATTLRAQFFLTDSNKLYHRHSFGGEGRWNAWIRSGEYVDDIDIDTPLYDDYLKDSYMFSGKTAVFFGDSITYGYAGVNQRLEHPYPEIFCTNENMTGYNEGVSNSLFGVYKNNHRIIEQVTNSTHKDADIVFVAAGINDWGYQTSIETFKTAVDEVIDYLLANYTATDIIFITPINANYSKGKDNILLSRYQSIITERVIKKDTSKRLSVVQGYKFDFPCTKNSEDYRNIMFIDGLHPTQHGINTAYITGLTSALKKKVTEFTAQELQAMW